MRREFGSLKNFEGFGRLLIALRIYQGWTQKSLAEALGVDPSQVSRDERNEYHGITLERASRILEVLGETLTISVEPLKKSPRKANKQLQST